ncbi:MAG: late competence development ComFB family protein [Flavonifractor plautii]
MAGKKGSRSSKTAHVLNLLSGGEAPEAPEQRPAAGTERTEEPQTGPTAPRRPGSVPSCRRLWRWPAPIARHYRKPFGARWKRSWRKSRPRRGHWNGRKKRGRNMRPSPPQSRRRNRSGPMTRQSPCPPPPQCLLMASPMQEQKPVEQGLPDGAEWVNVMLGLVEEKAERYVKMFGLCPCPRCVADVKALALTRLPAKYVVLPAEHKKPMLSLYQARYDGDVTTQVIYACKAVMDAPRHGAAQPGLASDRG